MLPPTEILPDALHARYCTDWMAWVWSDDRRFVTQRAVWLAVLSQQAQHTGDLIAEEDIKALIETVNEVDSAKIREREKTTHHETKAHLEEWLSVASVHAGRKVRGLHLGLTSGDVTETADWVRQATASVLVGLRMRWISIRLAQLASQYADVPCVGRTHTRPAQPITLGYRIGSWLEQWLAAYQRLGDGQPRVRQMTGAVGTYADLIQMVHPEWNGEVTDQDGAWCAMGMMRAAIQQVLAPSDYGSILTGEPVTWRVASQVNPRSDELARVSAVRQIAEVADTIATNLRLMVLEGIARETAPAGSVGSSAMPHKRNPRLFEQVHALATVQHGFCSMAERAAQPMWYEGDVSTSAARRVYIPGLWMTADAICNTLWHALHRVEFDEAEIARQYDAHLPNELTTGWQLAAAVRNGADRETAHAEISRDPGSVHQYEIEHPRALCGVSEHLTMRTVESVFEMPEPMDCQWREPA